MLNYNEVFATYFGKAKQRRKDEILALMHLAVDLNQKVWFEELCEEYNQLWEI